MPALLALCYLPTASALGRGVLWYESSSYGQVFSATHQAAMLSAGATSFTDTTSWPSSLSAYRVVFVVLPTANLSAAQLSDLNSFTSSGGIVVLVAEGTGYYTAGVSYLNHAAAGLGLSSAFIGGTLDAGCGQTASRLVTTPVLTAATSSLAYAYGSSVRTGGSGTSLYSRSGNVFVGREGHTILVGDGSVFYASCSGTSGNSTFSAAIYSWSCDYDEDLAQNVDCGGADLDDTDATIGATRTWYADSDGDGYGNAASSTTGTAQPSGYVADSTDCNDTNAAINPGAT